MKLKCIEVASGVDNLTPGKVYDIQSAYQHLHFTGDFLFVNGLDDNGDEFNINPDNDFRGKFEVIP